MNNRGYIPYKYAEVKEILDMVKDGANNQTIAGAMKRTEAGIYMVTYQFGLWKKNPDDKKISSITMPKFFLAYQKGEKVTTPTVVTTNGVTTTGDQTEHLIDAVGNAFDSLKNSVANLVEYEAEKRAEDRVQAMRKELEQLRVLQQEAKKSSIGDTLRRKLMGA